MGRSMRRLVNVASSLGRPSRLLKPPGILPAAYSFSSYATVNGKKGRSLGSFEVVAVLSTAVSPWLSKTATLACFATSSYSTVSLCLPHCVAYTFFVDSIIICLLYLIWLLIPIISLLLKNIHK